SSGTSMQLACRHLEDAGIRVEGGIFLVRFGWYGGYARLQELGYHVEAGSGILTHFIYHKGDKPPPGGNPSEVFPRAPVSAAVAPEALPQAEVAGLPPRAFGATGEPARPPLTLDADYPADGGVWVSLRSTSDIHLRHARDGFWHLPGEPPWPAPEGVIMAALRTAAALPSERALALIDESAIAVTFFTALEACPLGGLDNDRSGIVVRSLERPGWMGGALPRMPGILTAWDQYQHARMNNARLVSFEPHVILRHDVVKAVEPGAAWQSSGVPAPDAPSLLAEPDCGGALAQRARALALARLFDEPAGAPLRDALLPPEVDLLFVSVYLDGHLRGCQGSALSRLDDDIARLVDAALDDPRFEERDGALTRDGVAVSVAILHDGLALGPHSI